MTSSRLIRRGRIFPDRDLLPEELAGRQAERAERYRKCRAVFGSVALAEPDRLQPILLKDHYNWFPIVEPNSGEYFIAPEESIAIERAKQKYPASRFGAFRITETGSYGRM